MVMCRCTMMGPMEDDLGGGNPWAVPGSEAPGASVDELPAALRQPAPGTPSPTAAPGEGRGNGTFAGSGAVGAEGPTEVPSVDLRPMTVADVVDGAFAVIKARPLRLFGIAAVFVVPVYLLAAYLQRNMMGGVGLGDLWSNFNDPAVRADAQSQSGAGEFWATVLVLVVPTLALMFVAASIAKLMGAWTNGQDPAAGELLRGVGRRWWVILVAYLLIHVVELLGAATCYIGSLAAMAFFSLTAPVIGAEGLGPIQAMQRSARLAGTRFWPVLGINLLIALVDLLLSTALGGLPQFLAAWFGFDVAWLLLAAGNIIAAVITTPFVAAATVLLYLDLRVRTEGLDIELSARQIVDPAV
jgi:hypothetical protein